MYVCIYIWDNNRTKSKITKKDAEGYVYSFFVFSFHPVS